jgi:prephenate dehydrogenase
MTADPKLTTVAVLGLGQVGTSIALALRAKGVRVLLADHDEPAVDAAVRRGAGECLDESALPADLLVMSVSPAAVPETLFLAQARNLASVYTDVAGVKSAPASRARQLGCDMTGFVPGHPIGEEKPDSARADLFLGKIWALCQEEHTRPDAVTRTRRLVEMCGAVPVLMDAETHDQFVALISHVPYLLANAMAGALANGPAGVVAPGRSPVRDVTAPAAADPERWIEILHQNARWVSSVLSEIAADLVDVCAALQLASSGDDAYLDEVAALLRRGHAGRRRLTEADGPSSTQEEENR